MCTLSVSNVIYHKFSHGAAFYTLNGKNVNVMLEFCFARLHRYAIAIMDDARPLYNSNKVVQAWRFFGTFG